MKYSAETLKEKIFDDEIDIKEIVAVLLHYRWSIIFLVLTGILISAYIAYFKPSVYEARALVKITSERQGYYEDFLMVTPNGTNTEVEDELVVFKSKPLAERALRHLNIGTRYFTRKHFRLMELYKESPFRVSYQVLSSEYYGKMFHLQPIGEEYFRLTLESPHTIWYDLKHFFSTKQDEHSEYEGKYRYGEEIRTEWGVLKVQKLYPLTEEEYWFTMIPNEEMSGFVKGGIGVSMLSKFGSVVSISFSDTVPERAAEIVNRVIEAYRDRNLELKSESAKKQLYFIDMQLDAINKTLKGSAEKLQKYKATNIVVDLGNKAQLAANKLSSLESKLYEINTQIDIAENMLKHLKKQKSVTHFNVEYVQSTTQSINAIIERIQTAMAKYATLSVNYTEKHPGVKKLKRELAFLKRSLEDALRTYVSTLKKQKQGLLGAIEEQQERLKSVPKQEQQLEQLTRHFMVNEKIYSYLLEKRAETAILASSTISNIRIIEKADVPYAPVSPKRKLIVLVGLILGLIAGMLQAFVRNYFDDTVKKSDDIEKRSDAVLYGTLPLMRKEQDLPAYMEAVRTLWINLAFVSSNKHSKVISVTSTISGEGKSFTIYHLSRMIAKSSEHKVLVIDMDMRKPTLHEKFGLENNTAGISTLLSGGYSVEEVIRHTSYENLDVILSGPKAPNPTRLIMSERFNEVLEKLSKSYHYILIDTPPIGIVSDAKRIMHHSDMVLFLMKAEYSKKSFLTMIDQFSHTEGLNIGIVLNGVDYEKSYYYYGYKNKYMDRYYQRDNDV